MEKLNLYILEQNTLSSAVLMNFLEKRFDQSLNISIFIDGESLLQKIDATTAIVILDYDLSEESADILFSDIKNINKAIEVIMLSSNEEIGTAIDAYRKLPKSFVVKDKNNLNKIQSVLNRIIYFPVTIIQHFFGFKALFAIFIVEVLYIGLIVFMGFQI